MKKLLFTSAAILLAFISIQAQSNDAFVKNDTRSSKEEKKDIRKEKKDERITLRKMEGNDVSYQSKEEFYRTYGNVPDVLWTKGKYLDQALFSRDGVATTAYFDYSAQLVGSTTIKTFSDLPASAQKKITKEFKDYTVEKVIFFDDNEENDTDMILYGSQFDDEDNYFVEMQKDGKTIVVQVTMDGLTGLFTEL